AGKHVLLPFGEQPRYDLAYEEDGRLVKIQCKTGVVRKGVIWFRTHSVTRSAVLDYRNDIDFFAVYCHERSEVYLVPVEDVPLRAAHLRVAPTRNGQTKGIRLASQYRVAARPGDRI
ncbi:MAG TPA: group I intron-associated PD-(D/E)XK endonuclease, partial [Actinomycetota bacterium]|nr:group I intron-associated PD-(D/E)XK endonuclease [Actinomycetota bacterium]